MIESSEASLHSFACCWLRMGWVVPLRAMCQCRAASFSAGLESGYKHSSTAGGIHELATGHQFTVHHHTLPTCFSHATASIRDHIKVPLQWYDTVASAYSVRDCLHMHAVHYADHPQQALQVCCSLFVVCWVCILCRYHQISSHTSQCCICMAGGLVLFCSCTYAGSSCLTYPV